MLAALSALCSCTAGVEVACPCSSAVAVPVLSFSTPEEAAAVSASGAAVAAEAAVVVAAAAAVSAAVVAVVAVTSAAAAGVDIAGVDSSVFVLRVSKNRNSHIRAWDNLTASRST